MLLVLLTSCLSELPIAAGPNHPPLGDADVDADADTDTDTDVPRDEDCDNGEDDDLDGHVDCEDSDCLDECVEDCDNGEDDDADGDVDCADDECAGEEECGTIWTVTAETWTEKSYIAYGPDIEDWHGYPAVLWMRGGVELRGESTRGDTFACEGDFNIGPGAWDDQGTWWEEGTCEGCDFRWVMAPRVDEDTLSFRGGCPVEEMHPLRVGVHRGSDELTAVIESDWQPQYIANNAGWGWDSSDGHDFKWAGFWDLHQENPRSWEVSLD